MNGRFSFFILLLAFVSALSGCTDAKVETARLGFALRSFSVEQAGVEKASLKLASASDSSTFTVKCLSNMNRLLASFDGGASFSKIADLSCASGESSVTLSFSTTPTAGGWPSATAKTFNALLKAAGDDVESRTLPIEFARPQFDAGSLSVSINSGATLTAASSVNLSLFAQQVADSRKFVPAKVYVTSTAACDASGSWFAYSPTLTGVVLTTLNAQSPVSVKFADEVGNESACVHASILHDNLAPPALTFLINGGAGRTFSPAATLTLAAGDPLVPGDAREMMILKSGDCSGTGTWVAYATSLPWTLSSGSNAISAKFRDLAGNESACIAGAIVFDNNPPVTPTSLALATGIGAVDSRNPVDIVVSPVLDGDTATLYSDAGCATSVASGVGSVNKATVSVTRGTQGSKTYYAKVVNSLAASSSCSSASVTYNYDSVAPTITGVTSVEPNGNFVTGATINVKVQFSEPVFVTGGAPTLALSLYAGTANATYISGSGSSSLVFSYTVASGDIEDDLDYASTTALSLNGATVRDLANNDADMTLPAPAGAGSLAANRDLRINYVVNVVRALGPVARDYFRSESMDMMIQFDNPVTIAGTPRLRVNVNGSFQYLNYSATRSALNKTDILFSGTIATGLSSQTGVTLEAIELNGGTISNVFGAAATLGFTAVPFSNIRVYNIASRVTAGFSDTSPLLVREGDATVNLPVVLSATSPFDTVVKYRVVTTGTASSADHSLTDGTVTIPAGALSAPISFTVTDDALVEGTEAFAIHLYDASPGVLNASTYKHVYIIDNEVTDTVTKLAGGNELGCAVYASGKLSCWGDNSYGQLGVGSTAKQSKAVTVFNSGVTAVAIGGHAICAVVTGRLYCWGDGSNYQLGNGSSLQRLTPTLVSALNGVTEVSVGTTFTCAVYNSGSLSCWGSGTSGQLGTGSTATLTTPSTAILTGVSKVSAATGSACAVAASGLYCWGINTYGQLGINSTTSKQVPTLVPMTNSEVAVDVKHATYAVCIQTTSNSVYCWGYGIYGSVGSGGSTNILAMPTTPVLTGNVTALSSMGSTGYQFCALLADKTVKCWGSGNYLGLSSSFSPKALTISGVTSVSPGYSSSGAGYLCYTINGLSPPLCTSQTDPTNVLAPTGSLTQTEVQNRKIRGLSLSSATSGCVLTDSGSVECVGGSTFTGLGDGALQKRASAVQIFSSSMVKVYSGTYVDCAIRADKTLWCFGSDYSSGYPGDGNYGSRAFPTLVLADVVDVFGGSLHTCALKTNQQLLCWGSNSNGQAGGPTSTTFYSPYLSATGVSSASAGASHTCAVIAGGVKCWGAGASGQIGDGSGTDRFVKSDILNLNNAAATTVALGGNSSCALFSPGDVRCWGINTYGQLGRGNTNPLALPYDTALSSAKSVYMSNTIACGMKISGELYCWGYNGDGAIGNGTTTNAVSAYGPLVANPLDVWVTPVSVCARSAADVTTCAGDLPSGLLTPYIGDSAARPILGSP